MRVVTVAPAPPPQVQSPGYPSGDGSCPHPCDCGGVPCGEYLFDFRALNTSINGVTLMQWLLNTWIGGSNAMGNAAVNGLFLDDNWSSSGPSEIDPHVLNDTGLTQDDVALMVTNYRIAMAAIQQHIVDLGGFAWQSFAPSSSTCGGPLVKQATCASDLRGFCTPTTQCRVMLCCMVSQGRAARPPTTSLPYRRMWPPSN